MLRSTFLFAALFCAAHVADANSKALKSPANISVCDITENPSTFHNREITLRALVIRDGRPGNPTPGQPYFGRMAAYDCVVTSTNRLKTIALNVRQPAPGPAGAHFAQMNSLLSPSTDCVGIQVRGSFTKKKELWTLGESVGVLEALSVEDIFMCPHFSRDYQLIRLPR